jgi:DNA-binding IclR family transcriptional regulator
MGVKTADRTLDVFEAFAAVREPLALSELAQRVGIPMSSCFALVRTLQQRGYLYLPAARGGLYPTKKMAELTAAIATHDPLLERIAPVLARVRDETGETAMFSKLQGAQIIYLDVCESQQSIRYITRTGDFKTVYAGSVGKAILGLMPPAERDTLLSGLALVPLTPRTITSREALEAELAASERRGWYANVGESISDLMGVAVALRIGSGYFGLSVAGPLPRIQARAEAHAKVLDAARTAIISQG